MRNYVHKRIRFPLQKSSAVLWASFLIIGSLLPLGISAAAASVRNQSPNLGGLSASDGYTTTANLAPGSITHVWLIILENKSYNSEFSGVNDDTYLWQTLPSEGVLVQNYHGTGHTSMDNYITMVSGQAPQYDVQSDCSDVNTQFASNNAVTASYTSNGVYNGGLNGIISGTSASVGGDTQNWAYGQAVSADGPNSAIQNNPNTNGCTYPSQVATLFDQFNLAGTTWKGYAQDLGGAQQIGATSFQTNTVPSRDAGACGGPGNPDEAPANPVSNPTYLSGAEGFPVGSNLVQSTATGGSTTTLVDSARPGRPTPTPVTRSSSPRAQARREGHDRQQHQQHPDAVGLRVLRGAPRGLRRSLRTLVRTTSSGSCDTSTYTAASLVAGSGTGPDGNSLQPTNPEYSDQYVAKHFPFGWFESLTGVGGSGTSALTEPVNGGTQLRRRPHRQPRQPELRPRPRPGRQHRPQLQLDHPGQLQRRPRLELQGQQPLRRLRAQQRRHDQPQRPDLHAVRQLRGPTAPPTARRSPTTTPRRRHRATTPAATTPPTCSSPTTCR